MRILLIEGWELSPAIKNPTKIYPLNSQDRTIINEIFDKLHDQDRIS